MSSRIKENLVFMIVQYLMFSKFKNINFTKPKEIFLLRFLTLIFVCFKLGLSRKTKKDLKFKNSDHFFNFCGFSALVSVNSETIKELFLNLFIGTVSPKLLMIRFLFSLSSFFHSNSVRNLIVRSMF
nr:hypothetical protein 1634Bnrm1_p016 [Cryptomonas sp.]